MDASDFESELHRETEAFVGSLDDLGLLRLSGIAPNVHPKFPSATGHATFKDDVIRVKLVDLPDVFLHLCNGETPPPIDVQNANEQSVDLVEDWQDGREEVDGILEVGAEGGVAKEGGFPWVTTGEKVEEDDAEGPDIVE
jgi:hypothetical protein